MKTGSDGKHKGGQPSSGDALRNKPAKIAAPAAELKYAISDLDISAMSS